MDRPIPAFYGVYLLRSKRSPQSSLYIGSTPNPSRRLRQHNGGSKGGARRTSKSRQRPWKMCAIVTGFPSKIAALQFEWAWQHPFRTRHIDRDEFSDAKLGKEYSYKRLRDTVNHLHMLLRHKSFGRWPLQVCFFSIDAYQQWQNYLTQTSKSVSAHIAARLVSDDATIIAKPRRSKGNAASETTVPDNDCQEDEIQPSVEELDVTYGRIKSQVENSITTLSKSSSGCRLCTSPTLAQAERMLVCPNTRCAMAAHLTCLSSTFLRHDSLADAIVPTEGSCPECRETLRWADLVKDLSLRLRGQSQLSKLFRKPRSKKASTDVSNSKPSTSKTGDRSSDESGDDSASDGDGFADIDYIDPETEESTRDNSLPGTRDHLRSMSVKATAHDTGCQSKRSLSKPTASTAVTVIADSDSDDPEMKLV